MKTRRQHPKKTCGSFFCLVQLVTCNSQRCPGAGKSWLTSYHRYLHGWFNSNLSPQNFLLPKNPRCFPFLQPFSSRKSPRNSCPPGPSPKSRHSGTSRVKMPKLMVMVEIACLLNVPEKTKKPAVMEKFADFDIAMFTKMVNQLWMV